MKKNKLSKIFSFFIVFLFLLGIFYLLFSKDNLSLVDFKKTEIKYVKIGEKIVQVELADNVPEQIMGLSGRQNLAKDQGMLFIFSKNDPNYFWMKDMNFPIDIIWLNEKLEIIFIEKNISPDSFPKVFGPDLPSKYVLELSANFSTENNLQIGNFVDFLP